MWDFFSSISAYLDEALALQQHSFQHQQQQQQQHQQQQQKSCSTRLFREDYQLGPILGRGAFSTVRVGIKKKVPPTTIITNKAAAAPSTPPPPNRQHQHPTTTTTITTHPEEGVVIPAEAEAEVEVEHDDDDDEEEYAIKIIRKDQLTQSDEQALQQEIEILQEVGDADADGDGDGDKNPNKKKQQQHTIIQLYAVYNEVPYYYLVMEKCHGGDLYDRVLFHGRLSERESRTISRSIVTAVQYCHTRPIPIAHRDLKPTNILIVRCSEDPEFEDTATTTTTTMSVKLADFGFATRVYTPKSLTTQCGSPQYVAPEVLSGTLYDTQADLWSIGVIVFMLLLGHPPFEQDNLRKLVTLIQKGDYIPTTTPTTTTTTTTTTSSTSRNVWQQEISNDCKQFLANLLQIDPDVRYDAQQALQSDWIVAHQNT